MKACRNLVNKEDTLSIRKQCEVLFVNRSSLYYAPIGESEENLEITRKIRTLFGLSHARSFFVYRIFCLH